MCDDIRHIRLGPDPEFLDRIDKENQAAVDRLVEQVRKELDKDEHTMQGVR